MPAMRYSSLLAGTLALHLGGSTRLLNSAGKQESNHDHFGFKHEQQAGNQDSQQEGHARVANGLDGKGLAGG